MIPAETILGLLPFIQAFFFICLFAVLYKRVQSARYILLFMTFSFLGYFGEFLATYMYYPVSVWSYYLCIPVELLCMPILYIYVSSLTNPEYRFKPVSYLHFLPAFVILMINIFSFSMVPSELRVKLVEGTLTAPEITGSLTFYITTYDFTQNVIYNLQLVFYCYLLIRIVLKHRSRIEDYFSNTERYKLKWLQAFIVIITVYSSAEIIFYFLDFKGISPELYSLLVFTFISIVGFGATWQNDIYPRVKTVPLAAPVNLPSPASAETPCYTEVPVLPAEEKENEPDEYIRHLALKLQEILENEKQYLNSNLNIEDLASRMEVHRNTLSRCINEYFGINFHQYINDFRIKTASELLKDPQHNHFSIEGIALNAGFNSKSVFNPAFKKKMGLTPSEYRKKMQESIEPC